MMRPVAVGEQGRPPVPLLVGILGVLCISGLALVPDPLIAVLPLGALVAVLVAASVQARAVLVVFGGLAVLQSSQGFGATKLAYFLGVAVAFGAALTNVRKPAHTESYAHSKPLFRASVVLFSLLLLSFVVARVHGTTTVSWLRDAAPYLLAVCVPAFAIDVSTRMSRRRLLWVLVVGGVISGTSFTFEFASRHALATPAITRFALPSLLFPGALFAYAISASFQRPRSWRRWMLIAAAVLALVVLSGTRSALTFIAAPIAILFASRLSFFARTLRFFAFVAVVALIGLVGIHYVSRLGISTTALTQRFSSLPAVLSHPVSDQSYVERRSQQELALQAYHSSPLLGVGPGHLFPYTDLSGNTVFVFTIDTPLSFLAKFGLVGLAALAAWAYFVLMFLRRIRTPGPELGPARFALIGYFAIVAGYTLLNSPFEDKGFAFGLLLLIALSLRERIDAGSKSTRPAEPRELR